MRDKVASGSITEKFTRYSFYSEPGTNLLAVDAPTSNMTLPKTVAKDFYSEAEAARALGISIARLHQLLDQYVFNVGSPRPSNIEFTSGELLLLSYWNKQSPAGGDEPGHKVVSIDDYK